MYTILDYYIRLYTIVCIRLLSFWLFSPMILVSLTVKGMIIFFSLSGQLTLNRRNLSFLFRHRKTWAQVSFYRWDQDTQQKERRAPRQENYNVFSVAPIYNKSSIWKCLTLVPFPLLQISKIWCQQQLLGSGTKLSWQQYWQTLN